MLGRFSTSYRSFPCFRSIRSSRILLSLASSLASCLAITVHPHPHPHPPSSFRLSFPSHLPTDCSTARDYHETKNPRHVRLSVFLLHSLFFLVWPGVLFSPIAAGLYVDVDLNRLPTFACHLPPFFSTCTSLVLCCSQPSKMDSSSEREVNKTQRFNSVHSMELLSWAGP